MIIAPSGIAVNWFLKRSTQRVFDFEKAEMYLSLPKRKRIAIDVHRISNGPDGLVLINGLHVLVGQD